PSRDIRPAREMAVRAPAEIRRLLRKGRECDDHLPGGGTVRHRGRPSESGRPRQLDCGGTVARHRGQGGGHGFREIRREPV
ncbi:hypothetical protein, partial [Streptomyces katrae]|uniref:hypothetical protein n=1 Tax=Streptomyces katrae TaxID=68223 RepID=UPI001B7FF4A9